jgi:hypothetical protein
MTPVELAARVYEREECTTTFRNDLEAHLLNGYVFSTPEGFVMARPVSILANEALILDPWHKFETPDAWLIWLGAGNLSPFLDMFPFPLPFLGWQKRNRLRFYGFESALAHLKK